MRIKVSKKARDLKRVIRGLGWMADEDVYEFTYTSTILDCLHMLWYLIFPKKKPCYVWEEKES